MPIDEQLLLKLLGEPQMDPTAAFLSQAYMEGRIPGDPTEALQTVLSNLSPSMLTERATTGAAPGELLGIEQSDAEQALMQQLGLLMSPMQEASTDVARQKMMSDFLMKSTEMGQKEREQTRKETETGLKVKEAPGKAARDEAMADYYAMQSEAMGALTKQRNQATNLREMARSGLDEQGQPMDPDESRVVMSLAGLHATDPNKLRVAMSLLQSGLDNERKIGAAILGKELGIDTSTIAEPAGYFEGIFNRFPSFFAEATQNIPGREDTSQTGDEDWDRKLLEQEDRIRMMMEERFREKE